jgi:hypothetical protein
VDEMPLMYQENSLQMEWCLNCHRNPAVNLRPTAEIYNMAWQGASGDSPVWCADTGKAGVTANSVTCTTKNPDASGPETAMLQELDVRPRGMGKSNAGSGTKTDAHPVDGEVNASGIPEVGLPPSASLKYTKFSSQIELGKYLTAKYHIRAANELSSCEVCHR